MTCQTVTLAQSDLDFRGESGTHTPLKSAGARNALLFYLQPMALLSRDPVPAAIADERLTRQKPEVLR